MALDPISGQMVKVSKKRLMLQKMCLQLFAHAEWNLVELSPSSSPSPLPLSLQHELLSTLLCVCGVQHLLSNLRADATLGDLIDKQTPSGIFAFQVFFRWILRSICQLPLPLPVGTKAQIFSASAGGLPMLHNMGIDQTSSGIFVSSFVPIALKGLHHINSNLTESCFVPSLKSFKV